MVVFLRINDAKLIDARYMPYMPELSIPVFLHDETNRKLKPVLTALLAICYVNLHM